MSRISLTCAGCTATLDLELDEAETIRAVTGTDGENILIVPIDGWWVFWHQRRGRFEGVCPADQPRMPSGAMPTGQQVRLVGPKDVQ